MEPDTERSDQVVARVVAWHNRHPLATRITADQVHSVGVVSLPFAVQGAQVQPVPSTAQSEAAAPEVPALPVEPADTAPAPATLEGDSEAPTILERALAAEPAPAADAERPAPPDAVPGPATRMRWQVSGLPPRPPRWHPRTWWRRLRDIDPYRALFTEDFIAPLRPTRVARWAAAHGQAQWPLEPGAAQRMVMLDETRRTATADAAAPELDLHLITAAIGVGDARLRVLLAPGARGAVLGQRHWSRQRLAVSAPLLLGLTVALGAGVHARWPAAGAGAVQPVLATAAPARAAPAASAAPVVAAASHAPVPAVAAPRASEHSPVVVATKPAPVEEILPPVPAVRAEAPAAASRPASVEPRRGRVELPPLVPRLADAQRHDLRQDARVLRQVPVHQVKAWALVTATLTDRRQSERVAAQLHAVALLQPVPMRAELLPSGAGWRAVFWPFNSERDAEKVRLALADKGLRTEVLEF